MGRFLRSRRLRVPLLAGFAGLVVVVIRAFHLQRALFLADDAGLDATGFVADRRDYGFSGVKSSVREVLGGVKAAQDATFDTDVTLGPEIPISGDGRASWGPAPPDGTPPAGAPRG